jgi:hypothetical protein
LTQFFPYLTKEDRSCAWFQQDSATAHTADDSLVALEGVCGDRTIRLGFWPARSLLLNPCDLCLWGNLKDKVCRTKPHSKEELKENIRREILDIFQEELLRVNSNYISGTESVCMPRTSFSARFLFV